MFTRIKQALFRGSIGFLKGDQIEQALKEIND
jgi:hypothetical protein